MSSFNHKRLCDLKQGWDSYDAKPIDPRCIEKAFEFWRETRGPWTVVPCADGGVQLERHSDGLEIEIRISPASSQETCEGCSKGWAFDSDAGAHQDPNSSRTVKCCRHPLDARQTSTDGEITKCLACGEHV